jgi:hypothetical protein
MLARLPWSPVVPKEPSPKRLTPAMRRRLVDTVANICRNAQPTPFAFEGACRHGLRAGLCLEGWRWERADAAAAEIVGAGLRLLGAKRPDWWQGQREYTGHEDRLLCANPKCRRPIEREPGDYRRVIFCSPYCRRAVQNFRFAEDHRAAAKVTTQIWRDARRAAAPPKPCEQCGRPFRPLQQAGRPEPRFCSKSCAATWSNARRGWRFGEIRRPAPA